MSNLSNTVSFDQFNSMLSSIQKQSNLEGVSSDLKGVAEKERSIISTVLGRTSSDKISGVECFSVEFDKVSDESVEGIATVRINSGVPGFDDILKTTASKSSDIGLITGDPSSEGYLKEFIGGSSPEAVYNNLNTNAQRPPGQEVLGNLTPQRYSSSIAQNVQESVSGLTSQFVRGELENLTKSVNSVINDLQGGFINNLITTTNDVLRGEISQITKGVLPDEVAREVMQEILVGNNRQASKITKDYLLEQERQGNDLSDLDIGQAEEQIYRIDPSVSNVLDTQSSSFENIKSPTTPVVQLNLNDYGISDDKVSPPAQGSVSATTNPPEPSSESRSGKFTFVNSYEELITDFRGTTREITEVVVHWTAHFLNQGYVGSEEIEEIHLARGFSTVGYHYIIKRDGSLQRGRPINRQGAHALENGHNKYSIGIAFVAGYNCNSGNENYKNYISAESITGEQWKTLDRFLKAFYLVWPGGQVWGHNDTDPGNKVDPGIDMVQYVQNKFNKFNVAESGISNPLSPSQLVG